MGIIVDDFFGDVIRVANSAKANLATRRSSVADEKYNPSQPRDDHGRWSGGAVGGSGYREAATIREAEEVAQQWVRPGGTVDYGGVALEIANEVNKTLSETYEEFSALEKLGGMEGISFAWSGLPETADAGYSPGTNGLFLNTDKMGSVEQWAQHMQESQETEEWAKSLSPADIAGMSYESSNYFRNLQQYDRHLVDPSVRGIVRHEMGHHFDQTVLSTPENAAARQAIVDNRSQFQQKISHYASTMPEEYIAESFTADSVGEAGKIDPSLLSIFDAERRK